MFEGIYVDFILWITDITAGITLEGQLPESDEITRTTRTTRPPLSARANVDLDQPRILILLSPFRKCRSLDSYLKGAILSTSMPPALLWLHFCPY